jgi:hypothetical protein
MFKCTVACPHCKEAIHGKVKLRGALHADCFDAEIDVWFISLPDTPKSGFYEADLNQVMEHLKSADEDEPYLIQKQTMKAGIYYNLPDFEGF